MIQIIITNKYQTIPKIITLLLLLALLFVLHTLVSKQDGDKFCPV